MTIRSVLKTAAHEAWISGAVTPHVARHSYCTLWIEENGEGEHAMEKLSRQVGTSVAKLRSTYVHITYTEAN